MMFLMLKIFPWNFKGLSNSRMIDYIQDIMARLALDFLCLVKKKKLTLLVLIIFVISSVKTGTGWPYPPMGFLEKSLFFGKEELGLSPLLLSPNQPFHLIISNFDET